MAARIPAVYEPEQFVEPPLLNELDDRVWDFFDSAVERDIWVIRREEEGRPVPDGKPIFRRDLRLVQHRKASASDSGWVTKFIRVVPNEPLRNPRVGVVNRRQLLGWYDEPPAMGWREFQKEHIAGTVPTGTWPFTVDSAVNDGAWTVSSHDSHHVLEVIDTFTATATTFFEAQIVAVGAGGPGQDWVPATFTVSGTRIYGGAGGAAGGVYTGLIRFNPGDQISITVGRNNGTTAPLRATTMLVNNETVARGEHSYPLVNGTSWQSYIPLFNSRLGGNALPYYAGSVPGFSAAPGQANGWSNPRSRLPSGDAPPGGRQFPSRTTRARSGLSTFEAPQLPGFPTFSSGGLGGVLDIIAGGGGGAKAAALGSSVSWLNSLRTALIRTDPDDSSVLLTRSGGPGIQLNWWATARLFAQGGPGGSRWGPGNSQEQPAGTYLGGTPTGYGSGGRGGGAGGSPTTTPANVADLKGALGQPGILMLRFPERGKRLVWTTL